MNGKNGKSWKFLEFSCQWDRLLLGASHARVGKYRWIAVNLGPLCWMWEKWEKAEDE